MNEMMTAQKNGLLAQLAASTELFEAAGFGKAVDTSSFAEINVDLSPYTFLGEGTKAYDNHEAGSYVILSGENALIYNGHVDNNDPEGTVKSDLDSFPRLVEVSILLGQNNMEKVTELFEDQTYFIGYLSETMAGMMKAHDNGHIDLEAELAKTLS